MGRNKISVVISHTSLRISSLRSYLRILEGKAKSKARLKNEVANPNGVTKSFGVNA